MSTVVSGIRVKFGKTEGDVRVTSGGKLFAVGFIAGTVTVESGGYALIVGMVGRLVIEPGAKAKLPGMCTGDVTNGGDLTIRGTVDGDVTNNGGDLTIKGVVKGALHGESITVAPGAKIGGAEKDNGE